jgi:AraC family transcriptional regulator of adaptative response / DNA-3-methyladenine glycosylase II
MKDGDTARLDEAMAQINSGAISEVGVEGVANSLCITARHFRRIVKAKTGSSPSRLDRDRRLSQAKQLLQKTKLSIVAIAFNCDFASLRQFNDTFKAGYNITPSQMRKRANRALKRTTKHM